MIRLFVIDDDPYVIDGCHYRMHPARDQIKIAGSALNVNETVQKARSNDLDMFILDLHIHQTLPRNNEKILKTRFPGKPIVIFTCDFSSIWVTAMKNEGVKGYMKARAS